MIPDSKHNEPQSKDLTEMEKMLSEAPKESSGALAFIGELIKITIIALVIIIPVRHFLVKPFYVNGASMVPTYQNKEYLIIDEISYRFKVPTRGEVVVFKYPVDPRQFFIKRIIGLPLERITIGNGKVTIYNTDNPKGVLLSEPYLSDENVTTGTMDVTLGENEYYVLGDNRVASLDSRRFGPLPKDKLVGRAWLRGWPFDRIGILEHYVFNF